MFHNSTVEVITSGITFFSRNLAWTHSALRNDNRSMRGLSISRVNSNQAHALQSHFAIRWQNMQYHSRYLEANLGFAVNRVYYWKYVLESIHAKRRCVNQVRTLSNIRQQQYKKKSVLKLQVVFSRTPTKANRCIERKLQMAAPRLIHPPALSSIETNCNHRIEP